MKERKIGEIFEYKGDWYQCIKDTKDISCINCCFYNGGHKLCTDEDMGACAKEYRNDAKSICFKKLEKVGEPYEYYVSKKGIIQVQDYLLADPNHTVYNKIEGVYDYLDGKVVIEIKQNKEDMEEKNNGNTPLNVLTDKYVNGDICYDDFEKEVKALYSCKEEIKPTLKEFDLKAAKVGKPVCTRDGRKARIICFDSNGGRPIVALVTECDDEEEIPYKYHCDGFYNCQSIPSDNDLMMLSEKRSGWVNVYKGGLLDTKSYPTKEEAFVRANSKDYVDTIKINWSE